MELLRTGSYPPQLTNRTDFFLDADDDDPAPSSTAQVAPWRDGNVEDRTGAGRPACEIGKCSTGDADSDSAELAACSGLPTKSSAAGPASLVLSSSCPATQRAASATQVEPSPFASASAACQLPSISREAMDAIHLEGAALWAEATFGCLEPTGSCGATGLGAGHGLHGCLDDAWECLPASPARRTTEAAGACGISNAGLSIGAPTPRLLTQVPASMLSFVAVPLDELQACRGYPWKGPRESPAPAEVPAPQVRLTPPVDTASGLVAPKQQGMQVTSTQDTQQGHTAAAGAASEAGVVPPAAAAVVPARPVVRIETSKLQPHTDSAADGPIAPSAVASHPSKSAPASGSADVQAAQAAQPAGPGSPAAGHQRVGAKRAGAVGRAQAPAAPVAAVPAGTRLGAGSRRRPAHAAYSWVDKSDSEDDDDAEYDARERKRSKKGGPTAPKPPGKVRGGVTCRNCGVQETPQWRCGPEGPRTLCNACGVRFKKGLPLAYMERKNRVALQG